MPWWPFLCRLGLHKRVYSNRRVSVMLGPFWEVSCSRANCQYFDIHYELDAGV